MPIIISRPFAAALGGCALLAACSDAPSPPHQESVRIVHAPDRSAAWAAPMAGVPPALANADAEAPAADIPYDPTEDARDEAAQAAARDRDPYRLADVDPSATSDAS